MALEVAENIVVSKLDELASWCRKNMNVHTEAHFNYESS